MSDDREKLSASLNEDDEVEAHARSWQNTNEDVADDVEGHRLGGAWNNTNESLADDRESLADEVEAHARYAGNTNESVDEDDDGDVEAHMRHTRPTD